MRHFITLLLSLIAAGCMAPQTSMAPPARMVAPVLASEDARDPYSYAEPHIARVTHVSLDLALDFEAHQVTGTATLDVAAASAVDRVILDGNGLLIGSITDASGAILPFTIGAHDAAKGEAITVTMGAARRIVVRYSSNAGAEALQWLTLAQTAGGQHPFLFSQGQPILNRTWIPTQDSPGIRQTWDARITAPTPLMVVMSGDRLTPQGEPAGSGRRAFRFRMDKPVAPYLIAIAAGDIVFRDLGPRTGVWAEPAMIERAAAELTDTERMVEAAEALYGPYRWGRYDVIVLPPSFPFGGMENPTLTFLTPTFIAGDKSLVGLVAHELAHSWSGNLVTNANWSDSWLNEGVTSYFENRIMESLYGRARASQEAALSFADMEEALTENGEGAAISSLHLSGNAADPNGGSGGIIYDKGAAFLRSMEHIVGRDRWDAWLRSWFDRHAFQPATSAMLVADIREHLVRGDAALEARMMLDQWVYQPALPSNVVHPDPAAFAGVDAAVAAFAAGGAPGAAAWGGWTTAERLRYINSLPRALDGTMLADLDHHLDLSAATNNEILFAWLNLALANRYEPAVPVADAFLGRVGRRKFVLPLFRTLMGQDEWGEPIARRIYARTRSGYHAVTTLAVDRVMGQ
ncbi:MAG: M1 family metallopeptidase [Pseudomonadota bacterium]